MIDDGIETTGSFDHTKCPWPYFGGKSKAADVIWRALGDVAHYVEPFCGSAAVLLGRPHLANRPYYSETINDADGLITNAWRAIRLHPERLAEEASWPVSEMDLHARHVALVRWARSEEFKRLEADPDWCDVRMAGWWIWGQCSWIGSGWCAGTGPWTEIDGRLVKQSRGATREPGVGRQLPHISDDGRGVNHAGLREPGISRQLPHISSNGQGVNHPNLREPGVDDGDDWHPFVMPRLESWMRALSARLRHVRVLHGDWRRAVTSGAINTLSVRKGGSTDGFAGIFLDPPYADSANRVDGVYAVDSLTVAHDVSEWCLANGDNPKWRIVLAGFDGEHGTALTDAGWREVSWFKAGYLAGGMGNTNRSGKGHQQDRERLWLSPHCLSEADSPQLSLFGGGVVIPPTGEAL